jgi:hypothetical protein
MIVRAIFLAALFAGVAPASALVVPFTEDFCISGIVLPIAAHNDWSSD